MASYLDCYQNDRNLGISAEPFSFQELEARTFTKVEKSQNSRKIIKSAIMDNCVLRELESSQIDSIIDYMYPKNLPKGTLIIKEGEVGVCMYVIEEGTVEISGKGCKKTLKSGKLFGELALLYQTKRTATVNAVFDCRLWAIKRNCFQKIMVEKQLDREQHYSKFLKDIPAFSSLAQSTLAKIAYGLTEQKYDNGHYIVKQGDHGDKFFIITEGHAKVTMRKENSNSEEFVRMLKKGDFFGEKALLNDEKRSANVIAENSESQWVSCLVLSRDEFSHFKDLKDINKYLEVPYPKNVTEFVSNDLSLDDLKVITTLGIGAFGRVFLVKLNKEGMESSFALKRMAKQKIVKSHQQKHVMSERKIMAQSNCPFIVKLIKTFKDRQYLYILTECFLGGELWTVLRDHRGFTESTTRFYVACATEALLYLHNRNIIYRDLKPENLILDTNGYVKLVDLGFAKKLNYGEKTWTFCGTPEYVAPEIIMNNGHDESADYWALGILIFELMKGRPPFSGKDHMAIYKQVIKGIGEIEMPSKASCTAKELIRALCRRNPLMRIGSFAGGINQVQNNKWFEKFDWERLRSGNLRAPILPKVKDYTDASNFDEFPADDEVASDQDFSGWDESF